MGALDGVALFSIAHWSAVAPLVLFFAIAYAHRFLKRDAKGTLALVLRWPVLITCLLLPFVAVVVLWLAWNTTWVWVSAVAGAVVLANLYFFSLAALVGMAYLVIIAARAAYRWSASGRYRAGVVTGVLVTTIAVLYAVRSWIAPRAPDENSLWKVWAGHVDSAEDPGAIEAERRLFRRLDDALELRSAPAGTTSTSSPSSSSVTPFAAGSSAPPPSSPDADLVNACLQELAIVQVPMVQRNVQNKFRLSDDDAHDIVYEALLNVCEAHVVKRYDKLGAVLQTSAERRAIDWRRRRYLRCALPDEPTCTPGASEFDRAEQVDRILDVVQCDEDPSTLKVIDQHVREGKDFATIESSLGLKPNEARWRWNNFINRARARIAKDCGN